jgi:16S rRNA (guanine(527)-N(7))-methyltransferase RsmG
MSLKEWKAQGRINSSALEKLSYFVNLLLEWNTRINLTGFHTISEIENVLIDPCIAALDMLPVSAKNVLDFGSGAGIPGLVWSACRPDLNITSLEIRQKKVAFQKEVLRKTGVRAEVLAGRFPEAVRTRRFDVVATRAIRFSPELWDSARALLNPGGMMLRFASEASPHAGWTSVKIADKSFVLFSIP